MGDVNGDGTPDIIVSLGAGSIPVVEVIDGTKLGQLQATGQIADSALLAVFFAYDPGFLGGVNVGAGHLQAGAADQVIVGTGAGGLPLVRSFTVSGGVAMQVAGPAGAFFAFDTRFLGGVTVAAADFEGSGTDQIVTGAGPGGVPLVNVYRSSDGSLVKSFVALVPTFSGGVSVAAGDFTGSGTPSIVVGFGAGGLPIVGTFRYSNLVAQQVFYAYDSAFRGGVSVAVGDGNGDKQADIITGPGRLTSNQAPARRVRAFDGMALAEVGGFDNPFGATFLGGVSVG